MRKVILDKLREIEKIENVKIIYCVESGSRAWGFDSPDSDYDVRFIYIRPKEFYLRLDKTSDVIEWQLDETLDINGWDISKALSLLHKSNPTLFEWSRSPIVYSTSDVWQEICSVMGGYFGAKSAMYHYLSIAKKNIRKYLGSPAVRLKKYFYMLRPVFACKWIMKYGTPPPIEFGSLMEKCLDNNSVREEILKLLNLKTNTPEITTGPHFCQIDAYLEHSISEIESTLEVMPADKRTAWDELNRIFCSAVE